MQWSTHCNSEVARWSLRERGVVLSGPDPKTLVDEVSSAELRARMRSLAAEFMAGLLTWMTLDIAWGQRYAVTTYCRILCTLDTGKVVSKKQALLWARGALDASWSGLIGQVLEDRPKGFDPDDSTRTQEE